MHRRCGRLAWFTFLVRRRGHGSNATRRRCERRGLFDVRVLDLGGCFVILLFTVRTGSMNVSASFPLRSSRICSIQSSRRRLLFFAGVVCVCAVLSFGVFLLCFVCCCWCCGCCCWWLWWWCLRLICCYLHDLRTETAHLIGH